LIWVAKICSCFTKRGQTLPLTLRCPSKMAPSSKLIGYPNLDEVRGPINLEQGVSCSALQNQPFCINSEPFCPPLNPFTIFRTAFALSPHKHSPSKPLIWLLVATFDFVHLILRPPSYLPIYLPICHLYHTYI
jgi:hypothetical protein